MAQVFPVAGSKFFVGNRVNAKPRVTVADFANADWVEVDGWTNRGALGDTQEVGTQTLIGQNRAIQYKTTRSGGMFENQFIPIALDPGQIRFREAIEACGNYQFMVIDGADCAPDADVEISVGTPAVVTWVGHGFLAGQPIVFSNEDGALPTGLTPGTVYYVISAGLEDDSFSVGLAPTATTGVATTAAGTGVSIATAPPAGSRRMFYGLAVPGQVQGGDATAALVETMSVAVNSNIVQV